MSLDLEDLELGPNQRALYRALAQHNLDLAAIYLGGLRVLQGRNNPERIPQSAHSMRELLDALPRAVDVPFRAMKESLRGKVNGLQDSYSAARGKSDCHVDGAWEGEIDKPLRRFLGRLESFFEWLDAHRPRRKAEAARFLDQLNPTSSWVPGQSQDHHVQELMEYRDFFNRVAHHHRVTSAKYEKWLARFELFLGGLLAPKTFDDFDEIDALLEQVRAEEEDRDA